MKRIAWRVLLALAVVAGLFLANSLANIGLAFLFGLVLSLVALVALVASR